MERSDDAPEILIDTNLLMRVSDGFDLFGQLEERFPEFRPATTDGVVKELETIQTEGSGKEKAAARLALQLIKRQHLNIVVQSVAYVDDAILQLAKERNAHLATNDRELKRRARTDGIPVLTVKSKRLLSRA